jgi:hypothetical protein
MTAIKKDEIVTLESVKPKVLIAGGAIGLMVGLLSAYLLLQRAEREETVPNLTPVEGVKVGVWIFGLLRSISQL